MGRKASEVFSNVDAAWLHMEKPTNMAMITGVMTFDRPLAWDRLVNTVETRLYPFPRFRQRVHEPAFKLGLPQWETDPDFSLQNHLARVCLPAPAGQHELQDLASVLMGTSLDFSRPLWHFTYVEHVGQGSALIARIHHSVADGLALIQVLLCLTDPEPEPAPDALQIVEPTDSEDPAVEHVQWPFAQIISPVKYTARQMFRGIRTAKTLLHSGMELAAHPTRIMDVARLSTRGGRALGKLLLIGPDQKTIFKGRCGEQKQVAWSAPVPLDDIKKIAHLMGGTINDVCLSAVTGALRRYLESRDQPSAGVNIRAVVPVNLRQDGDDLHELGNRFGLVFLSLPVGIKDPLRRLLVLKKRMNQIKNSPEAIIAFGILNAIGMTPVQIESIIVNIFGMKGTAVMTNVPGPRQPIYFAGQRLQGLMFWVPQPGNLGMGISIISYAGGVVLGIATDTCLVPDPDSIIYFFNQEMEALKTWGRPNRPAVVQSPAAKPRSDRQRSPIKVVETPPSRCQMPTRSGQPCKNRSLPGKTTCKVHS